MKNQKENTKKLIYYKNGKIWFSKEAEKKFFFIMTLVMLIIGILYKITGH